MKIIKSIAKFTLATLLGNFSFSSYAIELNNTNIDNINISGPTKGNTELTTSKNYISNNDITSGSGRWLDMFTNNSSSLDLIITAPLISVNNYNYTTSTSLNPGGVLANKGDVTINGNVLFTGNSLTVTNSGQTGKDEYANGGAISSSKVVSIKTSVDEGFVKFNNNSVEMGNGGGSTNGKGVNANGGAIFGADGVTLSGRANSTFEFTSNSASASTLSSFGGAIYSNKDITLSGDNVDYLFDSNKASGSRAIGGALYVGNLSGNVSKINLNAKNSIYTFSDNSSISNDGGKANGGAIGTAEGGENGVKIDMTADGTNYSFTNNKAESTIKHKGSASYGGAIYIGGSLKLDGQNSKYEFTDNHVYADQAYGGALSVVTTQQMYENSGNGSQLGSLSLTNAEIKNNTAKVDIEKNYKVSAYGGAIYLGGANLSMVGNNIISGNSAVANNTATDDATKILAAGGAIYATTEVQTGRDTFINTDVNMKFKTNSGESIKFSDNFYSTTNKNGEIFVTNNDIYWDANSVAGGGSHQVLIDTGVNSTVSMLSSIASSSAANVDITKTGEGHWILGGESQLLGNTKIAINGGFLELYDNDTSLTMDRDNGSMLTIAAQSGVIGNYGTINGNVTNSGAIHVGEIGLNPNNAFKSFTIDGDYVGNGGSLYLKATLEDDNSLTDKLVITGNATGKTSVSISNLGGRGAQTIEGIKVVDIGGKSSKNAFEASNIVAGKYEYTLVKGNSSGTDTESWFLSSHATNGTDTLRPEGGSYLANLVAANTLFNLRLHDRLGETQYTDLLTGETKVTSMWLRARYGYDKYKDGSDQLSMKTNWNLAQLGGDIAQWSHNELDRSHLGVMAGYGRSSNKTTSSHSNRKSDSVIDGYSLGLYATWYSNDEDKTGLYVDSWLQWSDFNATVNSTGNTIEKYRLNGFSASLESGYSFLSYKGTDYNLWLQPKGQLTWMNVDADRHVETNNTVVTGDSRNIQSRLGLKMFLNSDEIYTNINKSAQIFLEANWLYNFNPFEVVLDGEKVTQAGSRNIGEIKVGLEGNIGEKTNIWFNFAHQEGDHCYRNSSVMLGAKYSF